MARKGAAILKCLTLALLLTGVPIVLCLALYTLMAARSPPIPQAAVAGSSAPNLPCALNPTSLCTAPNQPIKSNQTIAPNQSAAPDLKFQSPGEASGWAQALIMLWTVAVTAVAARQIVILKKQTLIQQKTAETAAYRPLISPHMQSIKRFVWSSEFADVQSILELNLANLAISTTNQLHSMLDSFRDQVYTAATQINLPLLGRDASLDDIEALVNEYNYLCKQLLDETLDSKFATEMSRQNLSRVHNRLRPFLNLRRQLSSQYASHFTKYVEGNSE